MGYDHAVDPSDWNQRRYETKDPFKRLLRNESRTHSQENQRFWGVLLNASESIVSSAPKFLFDWIWTTLDSLTTEEAMIEILHNLPYLPRAKNWTRLQKNAGTANDINNEKKKCNDQHDGEHCIKILGD